MYPLTRFVWTAVGVLLVLTSGTTSHAGATIELSPGNTASLGLLLQPQLHTEQGATADGEHWTYDPFIRRVRLMVFGNYRELVHFFVETDTPNWGKQGDWSVQTFIQDAFVELNIMPELQLDVGMLLVPFSHHAMQGATTLLLVDYHSSLIKYPSRSNKVSRDVGLMARGQLFSNFLEYRIAVTNGVQSAAADVGAGFVNRLDYPWVTGRVTLNLFEAEGGPGVPGYFLDGLYLEMNDGKLLSPKKILSFGASGTHQWRNGISADGQKAGFAAAALDLFFDYPLFGGEQALTGQINGYVYDSGEGSASTGMGVSSEVGYRFGLWQPVAGLDWFDARDQRTGDLLSFRGGVNCWLLGYNANLKLEVSASRAFASEAEQRMPFVWASTLQVQVLL